MESILKGNLSAKKEPKECKGSRTEKNPCKGIRQEDIGLKYHCSICPSYAAYRDKLFAEQ